MNLRRVAVRHQLLAPEFTNRLQHPVTGGAATVRFGLHQALVRERRQSIKIRGGDDGRFGLSRFWFLSSESYLFGRVKGATVDTDRHAAEDRLLDGREEVVTPGDRGPHRLEATG